MANPTTDQRSTARSLARQERLVTQALDSHSDEFVLAWIKYINLYLEHAGQPDTDAIDIDVLANDIVESHSGIREAIANSPDPVATTHRLQQIALFVIQTRRAGYRFAFDDPTAQNVERQADPVIGVSGQFVHEAVDMVIDGAGIEFVFARTYRNQADYDGPLGANWDFDCNRSVLVSEDTLLLMNGRLQQEVYIRRQVNPTTDWMPAAGRHGVIRYNENADTYVLTSVHGLVDTFGLLSGGSRQYYLRRTQDRYGNYLSYSYDGANRLTQVEVNSSARIVRLHYDERNRISVLADYTTQFGVGGRQWYYQYDDFGDLVAVISPATNDYPNGLCVQYTYSSDSMSGPLAHNLTAIIDADGQTYLSNQYGDNSGLNTFNRVIRQYDGLGETLFDYFDIFDDVFGDVPVIDRPAQEAHIVSPNGQMSRHVYNARGNLLLREEQVIRGGRPKRLIWRFKYNADGAIVGSLSPEGSMTQYLFGRDDFVRRNLVNDIVQAPQLSPSVRMGFGDLLVTVRRGERHGPPDPGYPDDWNDPFPDALSNPNPADTITKRSFSPVSNRLVSVSDPRFTNSPDPLALSEHPRYAQTLTRYEYVGPPEDPHRFLKRIRYPDVTWPDGSTVTDISREHSHFDAHGRILRVVDPLGTVTAHEYEPFDPSNPFREGYRRATVIDPEGLALRYERVVNELGIEVESISPRRAANGDPLSTHFTVNALGQIERIRLPAPLSYETRFRYTGAGQVCRQERDLYAADGSAVHGGLEVREFAFDVQGHLLSESIGASDQLPMLKTSHRYERAGRRVLTTRPRGNRIKRTYDERGFERETIRAECTEFESISKYVYDSDGLMVRSIDPRGNATQFEYDALRRRVRTVDALGNETRLRYDKRGNVVSEHTFARTSGGQFQLVQCSQYEYDELSRRCKERRYRFNAQVVVPATNDLSTPSGAVVEETQYFYDAKGQLVRILDPLGRSELRHYDRAGRLVRTVDAVGNEVNKRYDAAGNVTTQEMRDRSVSGTAFEIRTMHSEFDHLNRLTSQTDELGNRQSWEYDSRGDVTRYVDALGNEIRFRFDTYGRVVERSARLTANGLGSGNAVGQSRTKFRYDANNNVVAAIDPNGNTITFEFDALDRELSRHYADGGKELFIRDPAGNTLTHDLANGSQLQYTYDERNQTLTADLRAPSATPAATSLGSRSERFSYDYAGRVVLESNDNATIDRVFDSLGGSIDETTTLHIADLAPSVQSSYSIARSFDRLGNPAETTYPSGRVLALKFDPLNRVQRIHNGAMGSNYPGASSMAGGVDLLTVSYVGPRIRELKAGNGALTRHQYDAAGRNIEIQHLGSDGSSLALIQALYDGAGNIRWQAVHGPSGTGAYRLGYDSQAQLTHSKWVLNPTPFNASALAASTDPPGPNPSPTSTQVMVDNLISSLATAANKANYRYDLAGNRKLEVADSATSAYSVNVLNQYTNVGPDSLSYDRRGNVDTFRGRRYRYDLRNQLIQVGDAATGQIIARYWYDSQARRIASRIANEITVSIFDGVNVIEDYVNGSLDAQYAYRGGVDSVFHVARGGKDYWLHTENSRSVCLFTDQAGSAAANIKYSPFGDVDIGTGVPSLRHTYKGRPYDAQVESYDFRFRQYLPRIGRYLQRDLVETSNAYWFLNNNPLGAVDPLGWDREDQDDWFDVTRDGVYDAREGLHHGAEAAGGGLTDGIVAISDALDIPPIIGHNIAAFEGAGLATVIEFGGGFLMIGPNLMVGLSEVPAELELAGETYRSGIEDDPSDLVLGTLYTLDALGKVAAVVVFLEAGAQAVRTRSAVASIETGQTSTFQAVTGDATTLTENAATGKSSGRSYHLVTKDATGATWQKTTTVISDEGVVVRQHVDLYGRSRTLAKDTSRTVRGGDRSRTRQPLTGPKLPNFKPIAERPTFPAAWTGFDEIFSTAPHYARTATIDYRSIVSGQQTPPKTQKKPSGK